MKGFQAVVLATAVLLFAGSAEAFQRGGGPPRGGHRHHVGRGAPGHSPRHFSVQHRPGRPHAFKPHPGFGHHSGFKARHGFTHHRGVFGSVGRPHKHFFPPVVIFAPAPIYVAPPPYYWYYCQDPAGYYPYVPHCPGGWMPVVPH